MAVKTNRGLDLSKLANRKKRIITTKESLKDVIPIKWSADVVNGKKRVNVTKAK